MRRGHWARRREIGVARQRIDLAEYEADVTGGEATLGPAPFAACWAAGEALTWEQAVDEALGDTGKRVEGVLGPPLQPRRQKARPSR